MLLSLKTRLLSVEEDFLSALVEGDDALVAFESRWEGLLEDINMALETPDSHPELSALAHITATRMAALANASIDICDIYNAHSSFLMAEIDNLMSDLSIEDLPSVGLLGSQNSKTQRNVNASRQVSATTPCRKRSRSPDVWPRAKVAKRRRTPNAFTATTSGIPSPSFSDTITSAVGQIEDVSATSLRPSRKRRLSDADSPPSHPLKRLYTGPRVHAVSDSYPAFLFKEQQLCASSLRDSITGSPTDLNVGVPLDIVTAWPDPCDDTASQRGVLAEVADLQASCEGSVQTPLQVDDMDAFLDTLLHLPVMTSPQVFESSTVFDTTVFTDDTFGPLSPLCPSLATPRSPSSSSASPSPCPPTPPLNLLDCDIPLYMLDHLGDPTDDFLSQSAIRLEPYSALRIAPSSLDMDGAIQFSCNVSSESTADWLPLAPSASTNHPLGCSTATSQTKGDYPCLVPEAVPLVQTFHRGPLPTEGAVAA